jgi:hypothetical protein
MLEIAGAIRAFPAERESLTATLIGLSLRPRRRPDKHPSRRLGAWEFPIAKLAIKPPEPAVQIQPDLGLGVVLDTTSALVAGSTWLPRTKK